MNRLPVTGTTFNAGNLLRQLYLKLMIPTLKVVPVTDNLFIHLYLKLMIPTLKVVPVTGILLSFR
jgi:hypothetical protein